MEDLTLYLVNWLKDKISNAGAKGGVLGISGGIDSAVVAALMKRAYPDGTLGVIMPCHSNPKDIEYGHLLTNALDLEFVETDLSPVFDTMLVSLMTKNENNIAIANIKPRLRMTTLYYYASLKNYLVIGTGNRSEILTGYYTKYGDGGVDMEPIGGLYKCQVYQLAKHLNIPEAIIQRAPSAGLWEHQTDEEEMGISYRELDKYLCKQDTSERVVDIADKLIAKSKHKREMPPIPEKEFPVTF
ncbi:MAG: NAD(+) synthetase [Desulfitibacter sp. BRH_c19]|nr:MAG: NAD(+) synthetase [Desulfitibacter sp. BRH_c19]